MSKCVFAGCFDPFTIGHLDVVKRLSAIFEEVFVVVSKNAGKKLVADGNERFAM
ncbi:MAG TPA: adenylyltransferase/cytidyltransferase family protein, partial [Firmicutes bacterium]|nr:adenylyltransferase/cytidyltransferase family protein [Bacillota bacterium]